MDRIISRNRVMYKLSIIALVLYVLLTLISITSHLLIKDFEKVYNFRLIVDNILMPVMMIGYIAIYVLWTPDNEGNIRKRPTWQFVLLLVAIIVPSILNSIIGKMMMNIHFEDFWTAEHRGAMLDLNTLSALSNIIYYTFAPLRWAMFILLLIRCERKAKKILIICVITGVFGLASDIGRSVIYNIDDYALLNKWSVRYSYINFYVSIVLFLLYFIFTIVYTKHKYNELKPLEIEYIN